MRPATAMRVECQLAAELARRCLHFELADTVLQQAQINLMDESEEKSEQNQSSLTGILCYEYLELTFQPVLVHSCAVDYTAAPSIHAENHAQVRALKSLTRITASAAERSQERGV